MMSITRKWLNLLAPRKEETVCVSYPKSGRTWVRFALMSAGADIKYNHGGYATRDANELGYSFEGVRPKFLGTRRVFLHRNPIDTAVSEFYQIYNRIYRPDHPAYEQTRARLDSIGRLPPETIDEFVLHPIWGCEKVCRFNRAHLDYLAGSSDSFIVRYEDLRGDPYTHFAALLDFIGVKAYDIQKVVQESSFDKMRALELSADDETRKRYKLYGIKDDNPNSLKVRKGEVGGHVEELRPETIARAREICRSLGMVID